MKKKLQTCALALLAGGAVLAAAPIASAATVDCTSLTNPVYIAGAQASQPLLLALAGALGTQVSLIYAKPTSCAGVADILTPGTTESTPATYLNPTGATPTAVTCTGPANTASPGTFLPYTAFYADIGVSDVYASSCIPALDVGAGFFDFLGAEQPFEIAVPWASSAVNISADAAYVVFGFGAQAYTGTQVPYVGQTLTVAPWTVPANIWSRGDSAGVELLIGDAIGLLGSKWASTAPVDGGTSPQLVSSGTLQTKIQTATAPDSTIGILPAAAVDPNKGPAPVAPATSGGIKPLRFQAVNQDCGYYADSDLSTFDKINVRQGRYALWGPQHFLANVDSHKNPIANPAGSTNTPPSTSANVALVLSFITHATASASADGGLVGLTSTQLQTEIQAEAQANFIPNCAMQVQRSGEVQADGSGETSYQPTQGCGCFFESVTGGGSTFSTYCAPCTTKTDCTDKSFPACNFGYCEAQ